MSWKDLFIINDNKNESSSKVAPQISIVTSTPEIINTVNNTEVSNCQPHIEKINQMYLDGFEGLNREGYDFFEVYKAIQSAGADNPLVYPMAFAMAQSMNKGLDKNFLIEGAEFYISELSRVYTVYNEAGLAKKAEWLQKKEIDRKNLEQEVANLKMQIEALNNKLNKSSSDLAVIDSKYNTELNDIDCKLAANDIAKTNLVNSIEKVKQGLINNVK